MPIRSRLNKFFDPAVNPAVLLICAFFFSAGHGGVFLLALPFVIKLLGGSEKDVGLCVGVFTAGYIISCLTVSRRLDRHCPKRILQLSSAIITAAVLASFILSEMSRHVDLPADPVLIFILLNAVIGPTLALFWPPIMGWLSTGHEGHTLTKRFGLFNFSWSFAIVISPLFAGMMIQTDPLLALLLAAGCLFLAFISISAAVSPRHLAPDSQPEYHIQNEAIHPLNDVFRTMSRFSLVTSCLTLMVFRTQFALLFTEEFGFSASQFGIATTLYCLANSIGFYLNGKTRAWHYKLSPLIASQFLIIVSMLTILHCRSLLWVYFAAVLLGTGQSFTYSAHQYYCVSGKLNRSAAMAVHELLISFGYAFGAVASGYLAEYVSSYSPYWFCLIAVSAVLAIQLIVFTTRKK